jgi:pyridoxamine 5'-phosphate oxidase
MMTKSRSNPFPGGTASFDALAVLEACHAMIEHQLQILENLVSHLAARGADEEARGAAKALIRYFDTAAREHHHDEDEYLFPLLRELAARADRPEVGATLYELEREHGQMDVLYSKLRDKLRKIAEEDAARLDAGEVAHFSWLYRRHMRLEAHVVHPFAAETLSSAQRAALARRMAARREVPHPEAALRCLIADPNGRVLVGNPSGKHDGERRNARMRMDDRPVPAAAGAKGWK